MVKFVQYPFKTLNAKDSAQLQRYRKRNTKKQKHEKLKDRKSFKLVLPKE